jgi:hypothetical protein
MFRMLFSRPDRGTDRGLHRSIAALAACLLATVPFWSAPETEAAPAVFPAPGGIIAVRVPERPNDFVVSWRSVRGTPHHYNVSVYANGRDTVTVVPATETSLAVTGIDFTTTYRITVSTRDAAGVGSTSGYVWLKPAVPGAARDLTISRDVAARSATLTWSPPIWPGHVPASQYRVTALRLTDRAVVFDSLTSDTSVTLPDLDPDRMYKLQVSPVNQFGEGPTAVHVLGNARPGSPAALAVGRDVVSPGVIHVSWEPPSYSGYAEVTHFQVAYGVGWLRESIVVEGTTSADVVIDPTRVGRVSVRACTEFGCGAYARAATIQAAGYEAPPEEASSNPVVLISGESGLVEVETRGVVGSLAQYPRLVVRILPTSSNGGFSDRQWGQNGAQVMSFGIVPNGAYLVTVSGREPDASETELARKVITVGDDGVLMASDWDTIRGSVEPAGDVIELTAEGENRVFSPEQPSDDLVMTTTATLRSGDGYTIWFRANVNLVNLVSGYALQYDPKHANRFILRQWFLGRECPVALARAVFPRGFDENGAHRLSLMLSGDSLWASLDGAEMFNIESLSGLSRGRSCGYPPAWGRRIGLRTWSAASVKFEHTSIRS